MDSAQKVDCDPVIKSGVTMHLHKDPIKSAGAVIIVALPSHVLTLC